MFHPSAHSNPPTLPMRSAIAGRKLQNMPKLPAGLQRVGETLKREESKPSVWVFAAVAAVAVLGLTLTVRRRLKQTRS